MHLLAQKNLTAILATATAVEGQCNYIFLVYLHIRCQNIKFSPVPVDSVSRSAQEHAQAGLQSLKAYHLVDNWVQVAKELAGWNSWHGIVLTVNEINGHHFPLVKQEHVEQIPFLQTGDACRYHQIFSSTGGQCESECLGACAGWVAGEHCYHQCQILYLDYFQEVAAWKTLDQMVQICGWEVMMEASGVLQAVLSSNRKPKEIIDQ